MSDLPKISLRDDGPLVVEHVPSLTSEDGTEIEAKPVMALCRCGASANKPFCDGSHSNIDFKSAPDRSHLRNSLIDYTGTVDGVEVSISYTPVLCTHAAECQARAVSVFNPKEKPWVQPGNGSMADILAVMAACPSGALRLSVNGSEHAHMTATGVGVRIEKDGPYHITNVTLDAEFNGAGASQAKYSLCRCGLSKNKPFCDGSHYDANWSSS